MLDVEQVLNRLQNCDDDNSNLALLVKHTKRVRKLREHATRALKRSSKLLQHMELGADLVFAEAWEVAASTITSAQPLWDQLLSDYLLSVERSTAKDSLRTFDIQLSTIKNAARKIRDISSFLSSDFRYVTSRAEQSEKQPARDGRLELTWGQPATSKATKSPVVFIHNVGNAPISIAAVLLVTPPASVRIVNVAKVIPALSPIDLVAPFLCLSPGGFVGGFVCVKYSLVDKSAESASSNTRPKRKFGQ